MERRKSLILFIVCLFMGFQLSAQGVDKRFSITFKNESLSSALKKIGKASGVRVEFAYEDVNPYKVTANLKEVTAQQAVRTVIEGKPLNYSVNGRFIVVSKVTKIISSQKKNQQSKRKSNITGQVLDTDGEPLIGVTVRIKGSNEGALTDSNGNFSIPTEDSETTLLFTYIGKKSMEQSIRAGHKVSITLEDAISSLNDVVVTGYQTISKERATGSASIIKKDKLEKIQADNLSDKIECIVPGMTSYNGNVNIRGISSFSISSTPLLVLDGQPVTGLSLNEINPNDIESVTVLKDAAATSLYGVRASNGVIVLTTRKGVSKNTNINLSAGFYINPLPSLKYQHYASTSDIIDYEVDYLTHNPTYMEDPLAYFANLNSKDVPQYTTQIDDLYFQLASGKITKDQLDSNINALRSRDYRREYRDALQQMKLTQDYGVTISKAGDKSNLFISGRYLNEGSYDKGDKSDNFTFYLKNEFNLTKWLDLTVGANLSIGNSKYCQAPYQGSTTAMPYDTLYNQDGSLSYFYPYNYYNSQIVNNTEGLNFMGYNAVEESNKNMLKTNDVYWKLFTHANIQLLKDLKLGLKFQYENRNRNSEQYDEADSYYMRYMINEFASDDSYGGFDYNIPQGGRLADSHSRWSYLNFRAQFDYSKIINEKHDITMLLGGEIREDKSRWTSGERYGYDDNRLTYSQVDWNTLSQLGVVGQLNNTANTKAEMLSVTDVHHRYVSAYFNAGYSYDSRYALNASVRIEQADLFGTDPKYRYRPLWSVGASWNLSNEAFMKDLTSSINLLKLRMTYGITGNVDQSTSPYLLGAYLTSMYSGANLTDIITPPNKLLRWEKTSTFNLGVDFALLNKLNGSIDFYNRYSSDLLANKSLDPSSGFEQARVNNGAMRNIGLELSLSYEWLNNKDWSVTTGFTATYNHNKIKEIGFVPTDAIDMMRYPTSYYLKGDTYNSLYAYRYAGLTEEGNPSVYDADGNVASLVPVRDIKALVCVGQLLPKWNGGFDLNVRWKNATLYSKIVYYAGHSLRTDATPLYSGVGNGAVNEDIVNRWSSTNTATDIPSMTVYGLQSEREYHWKYADYNTASATFIKVRNIGLSYSLPKNLLTNIGIKSANVHFQVNNPVYWAKNKRDIDPEAFSANSGTRTTALATSYIFGININF